MTDQTIAAPTSGLPSWLTPQRLDRAEQVAIALLFTWFTWRLLHSENPFAPLALLSEAAVLIFILIRRPTEAISIRLGDWLLAITATLAPLLIVATPNSIPALIPAGLALVLLGNCMQAWAKLVLRRSFGMAPANRGIKSSGPYGFVRHPMYAGYLMVHVGLLMLLPDVLNVLVYTVAWWAQILRLRAEERLLSEDAAYREYSEKVRWRLVPGIF